MATRIKTPTIYKLKNGERVALKPREIKADIMKANNWTADQYRKQYDIFKNKLRAYESYKKELGADVTQQSVVELLYKAAKSKMRYGADYEPSQVMKEIQSFSAVSITKGRQQVKNDRFIKRQNEQYTDYLNTRFGDLVSNNDGAKQIWDAFKDGDGNITNPIKLEKALSDYAEKLHELEKGSNEINGETYGSDTIVDFNINNYL